MDDTYGILLVDSDDENRRVFKLELQKYGFEVVGETGRGEEVLDLYRELDPYLVIIDLSNPGKLEKVEAIREVMTIDADARILTHSLQPSHSLIEDEKLLAATGYTAHSWDDPLITAVMRAL